MTTDLQGQYEQKFRNFQNYLMGGQMTAPNFKLALFESYISEQASLDREYSEIELLLPALLHSVQLEVHLILAKLFDSNGGISIKKFIEFCICNHRRLKWNGEPVPKNILLKHKQEIEKHETTIENIKNRRDKIYAHLDNKYLGNIEQAHEDFPLTLTAVSSLVGTLKSIIRDHEKGITPDTAIFDLSGLARIGLLNMIANLKAGQKQNFPHLAVKKETNSDS